MLQSDMEVVAYIDESGTHDPTGKQSGSEVPVLCGYLATTEQWDRFRIDWKTILDKYQVPLFHAREFYHRDQRINKPDSPYFGWNAQKAEAFKYELAEVAGRHVPAGSMYHLAKHNELYPDYKNYPYVNVFWVLFRDLHVALSHFPSLSGKVSLVFDDKENDRDWKRWLNKVADSHRIENPKLGEITFGDKREFQNLPLQAADMIAHRMRQLAVPRLQTHQLQPANTFDLILWRNLRPNRRFRPALTGDILKEMERLANQYEAVSRAVNENTLAYFKLREYRRKKTDNS